MNKQILTTWFEISEFLGVSIETARKYYKEKGMPITIELGSIHAIPEDIKDWLRRYYPNGLPRQ